MKRLWTALGLFFILGCTSGQMQVTVERYHIDSTPESRKLYNDLHPKTTVPIRKEELAEIKDSLEKYRESVIQLQVASDVLDKKTPAEIENNIREIESLSGPLESSIKKYEGDKNYLVAEEVKKLGRRWTSLEKNINAKLRTNEKLLKNAKTFASRGKEEKAGLIVPPLEKEAWGGLANKIIDGEGSKQGEIVDQELQKITSNIKKAKEVVDQRLEQQLYHNTGDLVPRTHGIYQDMTDPFISYIAKNKDHWYKLDNGVSVEADGDLEAILVFENGLDARWKHVSIDPEQVILARARIARKVAEMVGAMAGIAAKAYGVPVPSEFLSSGKSGQQETSLNFSTMTGMQILAEKDNKLQRNRILDLKAVCSELLLEISAIPDDDPKKAEKIAKIRSILEAQIIATIGND